VQTVLVFYFNTKLMKPSKPHIELWKCPECGRKFKRHGQTHSCRPFPLEQHFVNKPRGRLLFSKFKQAAKKQVGYFKLESLECCIHFVSIFTFAAVKILKDKIRVEFSLGRELKKRHITKSLQMSAHRYLYYVDILNEEGINDELLEWIKEASTEKKVKTGSV